MAITIAQFKAIVDKNGGDKMLVSLMFNNAYTRTFDIAETFDRTQHLDEENELFIMTEYDTRKIPYTIVKPIEYLEGMVFATKEEDIDRLDRRYIHG